MSSRLQGLKQTFRKLSLSFDGSPPWVLRPALEGLGFKILEELDLEESQRREEERQRRKEERRRRGVRQRQFMVWLWKLLQRMISSLATLCTSLGQFLVQNSRSLMLSFLLFSLLLMLLGWFLVLGLFIITFVHLLLVIFPSATDRVALEGRLSSSLGDPRAMTVFACQMYGHRCSPEIPFINSWY
ncbi:hypothetical protein VKT23_015629 [Stygiomarasmius scandens]|uniref:Uncharacterized protein n=1 Tax=Marasmiellus scandens TaxID=2682957 RepID=A0ABR1IWU7_9AGAR